MTLPVVPAVPAVPTPQPSTQDRETLERLIKLAAEVDRLRKLAEANKAEEKINNLKKLIELEAESTVGQIKLLRTEAAEARNKLIEQINLNTQGRIELIKTVNQHTRDLAGQDGRFNKLEQLIQLGTQDRARIQGLLDEGITIELIRNGEPVQSAVRKLGEKPFRLLIED